ncbi:MAG TPA: hypothetical protein VN023_07715 [Methylovorus sp.]|jgi:hypothetical protein|nr:hypothetical protein [Methylovorus sp.]
MQSASFDYLIPAPAFQPEYLSVLEVPHRFTQTTLYKTQQRELELRREIVKMTLASGDCV